MCLLLLGILGVFAGTAPASAHVVGSAVASSAGGGALARSNSHAGPAAWVAPGGIQHLPRQSDGPDDCSGPCCCGAMCSVAVAARTPNPPLDHLIPERVTAPEELVPDSLPGNEMLSPPQG